MIGAARISLVLLLTACIVACGLPRPAARAGSLPRGAGTSSDAAAMEDSGGSPRVPAEGPVLALGALSAYAEPDTTEFDFPEDESDTLVRDITVWVIASAFVAYFIIKVFLEEDKDEPVDNTPPGKQI